MTVLAMQDGTDSYAGCRDNWLSSTVPNSNYGISTSLNISTGRFPLVKFDLSTIPSNSVVTNAVFGLYCSIATAGTHTVRRMLKDWVEGTKNGTTCLTGESCYAFQQYNTVAWHYSGATGSEDRVETASDSQSVTAVAGWTNFSSASVIADVQGWVNGTYPNYGYHLRASSSTSAGYISSENVNVNLRPILTVTYSPATPGATTCPLNLLRTQYPMFL